MLEEPGALAQVPSGEPTQARLHQPACIQHEGEERGDPAAQHQDAGQLQGLQEEPRDRRAPQGIAAPRGQPDANWQMSEDGKSGERGGRCTVYRVGLWLQFALGEGRRGAGGLGFGS